jgi:hypothetical protein
MFVLTYFQQFSLEFTISMGDKGGSRCINTVTQALGSDLILKFRLNNSYRQFSGRFVKIGRLGGKT